MANKKEKEVKVEALVNIKYDKKVYTINDEFKVRVSDALELDERGFINLLEDVPIEAIEEENETIEGE